MTDHVKPRYDFDITENSDRIIFEVKSFKTIRIILYTILAALTAVVSIISGIIMIAAMSGVAFIVFSIFGGATYLLFKGSLSKKTTKVIIDKDAISVGNNRYLLEHVTNIGYDSAGNAPRIMQYGGVSGAISQSSALALSSFGSYIYILYGSDRIKIIDGLMPQNVEQVYDKIITFIRKYGYQIG